MKVGVYGGRWSLPSTTVSDLRDFNNGKKRIHLLYLLLLVSCLVTQSGTDLPT